MTVATLIYFWEWKLISLKKLLKQKELWPFHKVNLVLDKTHEFYYFYLIPVLGIFEYFFSKQ